MTTMQLIGAILFGCALVHTFAASTVHAMARRHPRHAGLLHLLGEVEVVFGFWAFVLIVAMAFVSGGATAIHYAETRQYAEPLFVFVVMVVAASRPVLDAVQAVLGALARVMPLNAALAHSWLGLALVPLVGSLITEPAAMTLAALTLAPHIFRQGIPEWLKYGALGVLFVNVSIGGTLTSYAAPPVLMVAKAWQWDTAFMASQFGWKAALAVLVNATGVIYLLRKYVRVETSKTHAAQQTQQVQQVEQAQQEKPAQQAQQFTQRPVPLLVTAIHLAALAAVVALAHHPVLFLGIFLLFLGYTQAYPQYQSPLILKEGLLVGFFLAGLVVLGGMQQWWLQPVVAQLEPLALFFGAVALTAITDNAALTYLGSLVEGLSHEARYMLVAGAVAGGGLTVIANAPNPAGVALLRRGFNDESIGVLGLLLGALAPTAVAILFLLL